MSPLPTTATTSKQSAAKAAKTRKENQEKAANEPTLLIPPHKYAIQPVILPDIPESEISQELLQHFHDLGYTRQQIKAVAGAWLITTAELNQFEQKLDKADEAEQQRIEIAIAKLAAQMSACVQQRGRVTTPAILNATDEQLLDFIDYYEEALDELHPQLDELDLDKSPERLELLDEWTRLNTYLWECKTQAGTGPVTLQAITNQNLEQKLEAALVNQ